MKCVYITFTAAPASLHQSTFTPITRLTRSAPARHITQNTQTPTGTGIIKSPHVIKSALLLFILSGITLLCLLHILFCVWKLNWMLSKLGCGGVRVVRKTRWFGDLCVIDGCDMQYISIITCRNMKEYEYTVILPTFIYFYLNQIFLLKCELYIFYKFILKLFYSVF